MKKIISEQTPLRVCEHKVMIIPLSISISLDKNIIILS